MRIRNHQKFGVLGVLGVPESLQPFNREAFSHGTQSAKLQNTCVPEHQLCSENTAMRGNTTPPQFLPAGRSWVGLNGRTPAQPGANAWLLQRGEG